VRDGLPLQKLKVHGICGVGPQGIQPPRDNILSISMVGLPQLPSYAVPFNRLSKAKLSTEENPPPIPIPVRVDR
jgi:hypothetical protein